MRSVDELAALASEAGVTYDDLVPYVRWTHELRDTGDDSVPVAWGMASARGRRALTPLVAVDLDRLPTLPGPSGPRLASSGRVVVEVDLRRDGPLLDEQHLGGGALSVTLRSTPGELPEALASRPLWGRPAVTLDHPRRVLHGRDDAGRLGRAYEDLWERVMQVSAPDGDAYAHVLGHSWAPAYDPREPGEDLLAEIRVDAHDDLDARMGDVLISVVSRVEGDALALDAAAARVSDR